MPSPQRAHVLRVAVTLLGLSPALVLVLQLIGATGPAAPLAAWFELQCARDPLRTPAWLGHVLPVCARCAGVYFGMAAGAALWRPRLSLRGYATWICAAAVLMLTDVATEELGWRAQLAWLRVVTGAALGWPLGAATQLKVP